MRRLRAQRRAGSPAAAVAASALLASLPAAADLRPPTFEGDARLRHEDIDAGPGGDVSRQRYRLRAGLAAALTDSLIFHGRLATGTGDPASANLDFGRGFAADDVQLDRAWLEWQVREGLTVHGGRMKNPLYRPGGSSLIWDDDLDPDGVAVAARIGASFGTAALYRVGDQDDGISTLFALQAGHRLAVGTDGTLTFGAGYFDYRNTRGGRPFYRGIAAGNTVDAAGNYVFDYDVVELFAVYGTTVRGLALELFADHARNTAAGRQSGAFAAGVNLGDTKERGDVALRWAWHETAADAVIGTFTDSDLAGGSTDSRGHRFGAEYALTGRLVVGATVILSELGHFAGEVREFDRVMLDMEFRFRGGR